MVGTSEDEVDDGEFLLLQGASSPVFVPWDGSLVESLHPCMQKTVCFDERCDFLDWW